MNVRSRIIVAAAGLLSESPTGEFSTRAVSEVAGIQQPVLYRHFASKDLLLAAVVDYEYERYLAAKSSTKPQDPVQGLRTDWDEHIAFALGSPNVYRLLFSPTLRVTPEAARETLRMLVELMNKVAEQGRLRVPAATAAQMVIAANSGVAMGLLSRQTLSSDLGLSDLVRDAIHAAILIEPVGTPSGATDHTPVVARAVAATTLLSTLDTPPVPTFTHGEMTLLREWLARLEQAAATAPRDAPSQRRVKDSADSAVPARTSPTRSDPTKGTSP